MSLGALFWKNWVIIVDPHECPKSELLRHQEVWACLDSDFLSHWVIIPSYLASLMPLAHSFHQMLLA